MFEKWYARHLSHHPSVARVAEGPFGDFSALYQQAGEMEEWSIAEVGTLEEEMVMGMVGVGCV